MFWIHAGWINHERSDERARRERTCVACGKEEVSDGECRNPKCKAIQPGKLNKGSAAQDVLVWGGKRYVGDRFESAATKFKKDCSKRGAMAEYKNYMRSRGFG